MTRKYPTRDVKGYLLGVEKTDDGFVYVVTKRNQHGIDRIAWSDKAFENPIEARAQGYLFISKQLSF